MKRLSSRYKGSYLSYVLIFFFSYYAMASFSAVLSVYLTGIGKSAREMSFIVSASGLFALGMTPLAGYLCDRLRRSRQIAGCLLLGMGALALLFPLSSRTAALFLLNGLIMSFYTATMPVSERLAGSGKYRYGVLRVWGTLGYAGGVQAAGLCIQNLPPTALFVMVALSALLAILGYLGAEDPTEQKKEQPQPGERAKLNSFLKKPQFLLFLLIAVLFFACSGTNMTYTPVLLTGLGLSTGAAGTVLSVSTLVEIPLILFSHKFMDRFSGKTLLRVTFGIAIAEFLFFGLSRSAVVTAAAAILLKAIASTLYQMLVLKMVRNLVDPSLTTSGLAIVNSVTSLGSIALQNIGGSVVDRSDVYHLYLLMVVLTGIAFLLIFFLRVKNDEKVFG